MHFGSATENIFPKIITIKVYEYMACEKLVVAVLADETRRLTK